MGHAMPEKDVGDLALRVTSVPVPPNSATDSNETGHALEMAGDTP
jgi:hypothetical protein